MPEIRNKLIIPSIVSSVILLIIIFTIITYTRNLNSAFVREAGSYLNEISIQGATALNNQINGEINTIQGIAAIIGSHGPLDAESTMPALKEVSDSNNFKRMGIIMPDGTAHTTDNQPLYLGDRDYFSLSMNGETVITDILSDKIGGDTINVYSSPISDGKSVLAVLFATHNVNSYRKTLDISTFDGKGYSYVVKSNGEVILHSDHIDSNHSFNNINELPDGTCNADYESISRMKEDMSNRKSGLIKFTSNGTSNYMDYVPMDINDWYVLSVVPTAVVSQKTSDIMFSTLCLSVGIIVTFILLFIYIGIVQNKSKEDLRKLAFIDPVTGAYNYNMFKIKAEELIHKKGRGHYSMIQLDIDKFKFINDVFGYGEGNKTLKFIANVIKRNINAEEAFSRISNDFFAILMEHKSNDDLMNRIKTICSQICDKNNFKSSNYDLVLSVGIYTDTSSELSIAAMLDRAGIAMKTIKGHHQTTYAFYDDKLRSRMLREKSIENEMHSALESNQFTVYYQPKFYVDTLKIMGGEALVRWIHPERGIIPPNEFIPLFEKNGFIVNLDRYVFETVCKDINAWQRENICALPVSVNISRLHLHDHDFLSYFKDIMYKYNISSHMIEFEITESVVFDNISILLKLIHQLHESGILLSMDDFGTGYSSLNMLKDIPVDILKLDKSFFGNTSDSKRSLNIVSAVISLAQSLDITVVAEGVETKEQLDFLRSVNCDIVQGYYTSKPLPRNDFEEVLKKQCHTQD